MKRFCLWSAAIIFGLATVCLALDGITAILERDFIQGLLNLGLGTGTFFFTRMIFHKL